MADTFGLKIGLEGEKEFKKALGEINQSFKVLGSEMKLVQSQFAANDNSAEALAARHRVLGEQVESQRKKVAVDTEILSLPCSNDTDARSRLVLPLMEGMKLDVVGTIRNAEGELWYQVEYDGQRGYVQQSLLKDLGFIERFWDKLLG